MFMRTGCAFRDDVCDLLSRIQQSPQLLPGVLRPAPRRQVRRVLEALQRDRPRVRARREALPVRAHAARGAEDAPQASQHVAIGT